MTKIAYVDPVGGAAGDMLLAALLDAGASLDAVQAAVDAVLPHRFQLTPQTVTRAGLRALLLSTTGKPSSGHAARRVADLRDLVRRAPLPASTAPMALAVLDRLARAEARTHNVDVEQLTLHELAGDDTLMDIVGIAAALQDLGVERLAVGRIPVGFDQTVVGDHGRLPLPAPATLELLRGFGLRGAADGELVTPTAAAVLATLGSPSFGFPAMLMESVGYGAGTRDSVHGPNIVRVLLGVPDDAASTAERELTVLETNLDDLSPELVADATEHLRQAGALDVWLTPVQMKKGRPGVVLSVLCQPEQSAGLRRALFESTSTFGVRATAVRRTELQRHLVHVPLTAGRVRVKVGSLGRDVLSVTPEHDDVAAVAQQSGTPVRRVYDEAVAAARTLYETERIDPDGD